MKNGYIWWKNGRKGIRRGLNVYIHIYIYLQQVIVILDVWIFSVFTRLYTWLFIYFFLFVFLLFICTDWYFFLISFLVGFRLYYTLINASWASFFVFITLLSSATNKQRIQIKYYLSALVFFRFNAAFFSSRSLKRPNKQN